MKRKLHLLLTLLLLAVCATGGAETVVFNETFNKCSGPGGNDNKWSDITSKPHFNPDNKWDAENAFGANKCARLGKGNGLGYATTPSIKLTGNGTLTFKAGAWNGTNEKLTISLSATNAKLDKTSITLTKAAFTDYTVNITNATGDVTITFSANATYNNRFFLDEVKVTTVPQGPSYIPATLTGFAQSGNDYYATFSSDKVTFFPESDDKMSFMTDVQKAYAVENLLELKDLDTTKVTIDSKEVSGYFVPANTGVLIKASFDGASSIPYYTVSGKEVTALEDNMLYPASKAMSDLGDGYYFYKLAYDDYTAKTGLGFYWGAAGGAAFTAKSNGAYLAVEKTASAKSAFRFDGTTTAISAINTENAKTGNAVYNIQGQRVGANYKGLVIVNGKKVIKK